jgi:hypothetical protein
LRIPVPDTVSQTGYTALKSHDSSDPWHNWLAILNYFSNPWDRKTVFSHSPRLTLHFLSVLEKGLNLGYEIRDFILTYRLATHVP